MSKLIRHTQKRGTALFVALQLTALTVLSLVSFVGGPQSRDGGTPAETQVSTPVAGGADAAISSDQDQTQTAQPITAKDLTAADKIALRKSAHFANKLQEPLASQVFDLATARAADALGARQDAANNEQPYVGPSLTTDREDYAPYTYVYFMGTGFQPGETVNMIVAKTNPNQQSFQPWDVVADANGNFQTSWYVFSSDFIGARFQAIATGDSSQLSAVVTPQAAPITGSISVRGGATLDTLNVNTATKVTGWQNAAVVSRSGDFATFVNVGASVTMTAPWNFNSGPLPALWNVGGFTFDLTSSSIVTQGGGFLSVAGTGTISGNGFANTPGSWRFSTQNPPANGVFSFSASTTANPP